MDKTTFPVPPIRPAGAADTGWISQFLRERWGAATVVVHGEVIDASPCTATVTAPHRSRRNWLIHPVSAAPAGLIGGAGEVV